jgi:hypothetical protein
MNILWIYTQGLKNPQYVVYYKTLFTESQKPATVRWHKHAERDACTSIPAEYFLWGQL